MINNHYSTDIQLFKNALNLQGTSQEKTLIVNEGNSQMDLRQFHLIIRATTTLMWNK